jgi:hypothetical protein
MAIQTPTKRCRRCKLDKPLREYQLPRHKLCSLCLTRGVLPRLGRAELVAQEQQRAQDYALAKHQERTDMAARGEAPWQPILQPPIDEWDRYKDYMVKRARQLRADKEALARAAGEPVKTPTYSTIKWCVRCKKQKHVSQFGHPRYRICLECDGPPMA